MSEPEHGTTRVFHFITRLLRGGAEAKTLATVEGLDNFEFTVGYGASFDRGQVDRLASAGVETKRFPLVRHYNPATMVPAVVSLARYLRRNDFDIVHTHSTEAGIVGRFAASIANVPAIVHTVHGIPFSEDRNQALNRFVLTCERLAARQTDRIITNADVIADDYLARGIGKPEQYRTIYSGVEIERFHGVQPAADLPGERPRVVMIGRLAKGKGFEVLLEAAESIDDREFSVCLVGEGPLSQSLSSEINGRGLSDRVFLLGYREDIPNVLAASDILVLPSYREGTPRVVTEAMASGLPVIATDIAGIPEQVADGDSGYLIPTGDPAILAEKLSELLSNRERRREMGERGRELVEKFSVETMLNSLDMLYHEVLCESDSPTVRGQ